MYLMYVDECGDCGMGAGASRYFALSAIVLHEAYWTDTMARFGRQRDEFREYYGLDPMTELHAAHMVGRTTQKYRFLDRSQKFAILKKALHLESEMSNLRVVNVVVDKAGKAFGYDVFGVAWNTLINRFENTLEHGNFPSPGGSGSDRGLIIVDETDEVKLRTLIRGMRHGNLVPSKINIGQDIRHDLKYVIEDPLHKQSDTSMLIQMCDVNAYFLKQSIEPNATVQRFKAKNYFYILKPILLTVASRKNEYGIVFR